MKVKDLKKQLESFDDELDVICEDDEFGPYDAEELEAVKYYRDKKDQPHIVKAREYSEGYFESETIFKALFFKKTWY